MGEKNLWSKVGLVVLLVGLSLWQIFPYETRLKPGIDLGGGYSATFEIDDTNDHSPDLAERVMNILKQRIDPGSTRNLVWRPIGRNRLEIQMPLAHTNSQTRTDYENARRSMMDTAITEAQIRAALVLPPAQRDERFSTLARGVPSRGAMFAELSKVDDEYRRLESAADTQPAETQPTTTRPAATRPAGPEMGSVIENRQKAIAKLLETNLNVQAVLDRLELGRNNTKRAGELEELKKQHPDMATKIDALTTAYDKWSEHKSMLEDPSDLLRMLKGAGVLEFRILATRSSQDPGMLQAPKAEYNERIDKYMETLAKRGPRPEAGDNYAWFKVAKPRENSILESRNLYVVSEYLGTAYVLAHATPDMGLLNDHNWSLVGAFAGRDNAGRLAVDFELDSKGGDRFAKMTSENLKRPLCIFLDNEAISAATIQSTISTRGQISGNFSQQEVQYLVNTLEAGALPARLKEVPIQERNVGPSLGNTNIKWGLISTGMALAAVIFFMTIYYAYNGAIADVALIMNLVITLGTMSFLGATFTLPGIAGLILTLGMAVDANVLIFERMREELQKGVSARMAVKLGYERAFSAIFDGNVTTIITAVILYWIGSEEIKGFGLTLSLGLAISMFTALYVTRLYYNVMIPLTLNREEIRRAWTMPVIASAAGGLFIALGYALHRDTGFGRFVLVLGLTAFGILGTMWAFRGLYKAIGHQKANRLPMMKLLSTTNIHWMGIYWKFWTGSGVVIGFGILFMMLINKNDVMDIEFIGGTDVQVQLKPGIKMSDEQLSQYIDGGKEVPSGVTSVSWLRSAAKQLQQASVVPAGDARYNVAVADKQLSSGSLQALILSNLGPYIERNGITPAPAGIFVQFDRQKKDLADLATAQRMIQKDTGVYVEKAADRLAQARVQSVYESDQAAFDIITTETARLLVGEALMASMHDILQVKQSIEASLVTDPEKAPDGVFPVKRNASMLSDVIGGEWHDDISAFKGGLVMVFDNLRPADTVKDVEDRLKQMRLQPDFESTGWRQNGVIGLDPTGQKDAKGDPLFKRIAVAVVDANTIYDEDGSNDRWRSDVAEREKTLTEAALASSQSLQRVTQFAPQVASEAAQKAVIALVLSFIAIAAYLWVRFGSVDFGLSGIIALYHDVLVALAAVLACHYLHNTWLGKILLLRDFKIDLNIIAALLTIVGYSINDSIVIFDRIRENRGRLGVVSPSLVNDSINQTLSRTVLTVFTVFLVVLILYVFGGEGIHGFAFTMLIGSITGVYSTIAVATPMVVHPRIMWGVTIFITASTLLGIALTIENPIIKFALMAVILIGALAAVYRQYVGHQEETAAAGGRQPAMR